MRMVKVIQVLTVVCAWMVWQTGIAAAQAVAAAPPMQLFGPLYGYGPAPAPTVPPRYRQSSNSSRYAYSYYRPRAPGWARAGGGYGSRNRAQSAWSFRYWRPRPPVWSDSSQFAAQIITPRWFAGRQRVMSMRYPPYGY